MTQQHYKRDLRELGQLRADISDLEDIVLNLEVTPHRWQIETHKMERDYHKLLYREKTGREYKSLKELREAINE